MQRKLFEILIKFSIQRKLLIICRSFRLCEITETQVVPVSHQTILRIQSYQDSHRDTQMLKIVILKQIAEELIDSGVNKGNLSKIYSVIR